MNKNEAAIIQGVVEMLSGHCVFWACDGPDHELVDMKTCNVCRAVQELRHLTTAIHPNGAKEDKEDDMAL